MGSGPQLGVDRGWAWSLNQDLSQGSELDSNRKVSVLLLAKKEKDLNSTLLGYVTWRRIHLRVKEGIHHRIDGPAFEQTLGVGDGQGSLACMGLQRVRHD